jgi:hypothetical protein
MVTDILSPEIRLKRPTEYRVRHDFRHHVFHLLEEDERESVRNYFNRVTSRLSDRIFGEDADPDGISTLLHTKPKEGFRLQGKRSLLTVDILKIQDHSRVAFDLGLLLCLPDLGIEHGLLLHSCKLKKSRRGTYDASSTYEGLDSPEELSTMDQGACLMMNLHPRGGMFLFLNPSRVPGARGGFLALPPEVYLTLPHHPTCQMIADEAIDFGQLIAGSFFSGLRGTTHRNVVDVVTNAHPQLYAHTTIMITLREAPATVPVRPLQKPKPQIGTSKSSGLISV